MPYITNAAWNKLPPFLKQRYQDIADEASRIYGQDRENPVPYLRQRIADIDMDLNQAHNRGRRNVDLYEPYIHESKRRVEEASKTFPEGVDEYMNPYVNSVVDRLADEGSRTFREKIMPQLEGKFVRLGQHGSKRHQEQARIAARELQEDILARQNQALERGYQQAGQMFNADKARQMMAAEKMGGLGAMHQAGNLADIAMLENQGKYRQAHHQGVLNQGYDDWLRQQNHSQNKLNQYMASLQQIPYENRSMNASFQPAAPQVNAMGNLGQLAMNLYGARMAAGHARGGYIR